MLRYGDAALAVASMCSLPAIGFDTETFYCKKTYSVKDLGPWHYCRHERFNCYLISVSDGGSNWVGHPRDFNFQSLKDRVLVSQNRAFDFEVAKACEESGIWPKIECAEWHCTGNMSAHHWNVRSLADAVRIGLGIEVSKDNRDRADGKTEADMKAEGWYGDMCSYAGLDAQYAQQLWTNHSHKWPEFERRISNLSIEQGRHGVAIDIPKLDAGIILLQRVIFTATQGLPWIERGRKPGSPIGQAEQCRMEGIPCAPVKTHEPEAYEEWLDKYSEKYIFVRALKNLKRAEKMIATLETIKRRLRPDGTACFSLLYFGAHTGRFSGTGGWNLLNPNKIPLFVGNDGLFIMDSKRVNEAADAYDKDLPLPEYVADLIDLRGLIIARPDRILCPVDLAQIEPRVINWVVDNKDFLDLVAQGQSPYEAHARLRMGWTGGKLKDENKKMYAYSKERVIQLNYQCGYLKFMKRSILNGIDICENDREVAVRLSHDGQIKTNEKGVEYIEVLNPYWKPEYGEAKRLKKYKVEGCNARDQVNDFRKDKKITGLWASLQEALVNAVGKDLVVELPSGRKLTYRDVKVQLRRVEDEETGEWFNRKVLTALIGTKRKVLYGGLLTENLCQAIARDDFCEGMLRIVDAGHDVLFHLYDEAVCEVTLAVSPKEIEGLMAECPTWLSGCPIAAEAILTSRYKK